MGGPMHDGRSTVRVAFLALIALALGLAAPGARAKDPDPAQPAQPGASATPATPDEKPWEFSFLGYGWLLGVNLEVETKQVQESVNIDFSDIFDALGWAGM